MSMSFLFGSELWSQENWEMIRDKDEIEIFTRMNEGMSFKEFKANMIVKAELEAFVAVLFDVEALEEWGHNVKSAALLRRPADTLNVYYAVAKTPFPYKNRDGVYLNRFIWDKKNQVLQVDIEMLDEHIDTKEELVRMSGYGYWKVKVLPGGELKLDFQMQVDPGGSVPAWLANMFAADSPYHTMAGIRKALKNKKYQGKSYSFLK